MDTKPSPADVLEFTLDQPEFDWDDDISPALALNLSLLGDHDMRTRIAAHRSITDEAGVALLSHGDKNLGLILRKNIAVSPRLFELAAKRPKRAAKLIGRAARKQEATERRAHLAFLATIENGTGK